MSRTMREELRGVYLRVTYPPLAVPDVQQALGPFPRREQHPLIRLGHLSGSIYCVTKYRFVNRTATKGVIVAGRKYDVTDQVLAIVRAWSRFQNRKRAAVAKSRRPRGSSGTPRRRR